MPFAVACFIFVKNHFMTKRRLLYVNMDIFLLIINMFVSHLIVGSPLYGAMICLFTDMMFMLKNDNIIKIITNRRKTLFCPTITFSLLSVILFLFLFHSRITVSFNVLLSFMLVNLLVLCVKEYVVKNRNVGEYNLQYDNLTSLFSFKLFHGMMFFSRLSLITGIMILISYFVLGHGELSIKQYLVVLVWVLAICLLYNIFNNIVRRNTKFTLFVFVTGALLWIVATLLFLNNSRISIFLSLIFFSMSISFINSSLTRFNNDFEMVLKFVREDDTEDKIRRTDNLNILMASFLSVCIMIIIVATWFCVGLKNDGDELANMFTSVIVQMPIVFMIISVFYALNQPLDYRTREKLMNYLTISADKEMGVSLYKILIRKYRTRYGVKIIATFVRPWLHLMVKGLENLDNKNYPSVFVCNHGIIYGPVAAVIYMPTYFRPWIDKKMLDVDLATEEMYSRFMYRVPLFGEKFKKRLANWLAHPVVWAMNSFNPIGVERDNIRNVMTTFNDTIKALKESDNILLFPERPAKKVVSGKETVVHSTDNVGTLFKGFAKLGNMYWKETGKCLAFYPIYADKERHTFTIGEAVVYEPNNNVNDERDRIAEELKRMMEEMVR